MKYNPEIHHRRSIRLKGYDYSQPGAYFVTICTQKRACLFGKIRNGRMELNDAGRMVMKWYHELENKFPDIKIDECICMPDHIHFIVINDGVPTNMTDMGAGDAGADLRVCPGDVHQPTEPPRTQPDEHVGLQSGEHADFQSGEHVVFQSGEHIGSPLWHVVQWFKTMTTNDYIRGVKQHGWSPFPGKLWQRNYYERIIRNEIALNAIRRYIINNPKNW